MAEEFRNLATRSAGAAKTTAALIEQSQKNAGNVVKVSIEVGEVLKHISIAAGKVSRASAEVTPASEEQRQGIDRVNLAVGRMEEVTQANADHAQASPHASEELTAQTHVSQGMVSQLVKMVGGADRPPEPQHIAKGPRHDSQQQARTSVIDRKTRRVTSSQVPRADRTVAHGAGRARI